MSPLPPFPPPIRETRVLGFPLTEILWCYRIAGDISDIPEESEVMKMIRAQLWRTFPQLKKDKVCCLLKSSLYYAVLSHAGQEARFCI